MGRKTIASATPLATKILSNFTDGEFIAPSLKVGGKIQTTRFLFRDYYLNSKLYINTIGDKYAVRWLRSTDPNFTPATRPLNNITTGSYPSIITYLGIFDSNSEVQTAVNSALGYNFNYGSGDGGVGLEWYDIVLVSSLPVVDVYQLTVTVDGALVGARKPTYIDLLKGYYLDTRSKPSKFKVTPIKTGKLSIGYYRENIYEPIPDLRSIDWYRFDIEVIKDETINLPIIDPVLGTLWISDSNIISQITSQANLSTEYSYNHLFPNGVNQLFSYWYSLYSIADSKPLPGVVGIITGQSESYQVNSFIRRIGANNNVWGNNTSIIQDIGFNVNHRMFKVDVNRTFSYHFKPQIDGTLGNLVMNSPQIIDIWTQLCSQTPAKNDLDPDLPRLNTLGMQITQQSKVLGIRNDANGQIDKEKEKELTRRTINSKERLDEKEYAGSCFGTKAMLVRRVTNIRDKTGIVNGGVVAIGDLPQLMLEVLDQLNLGIGLQDSSAIEIKHDGIVHKYNSLLELLTEIAIHQFNQSQYARATHISSIVTQEQTKELIGGLGLPTVSKQLQRKVNGNNVGTPYWGIAPQASLAKKIDTCTYNVGVVLGHII